MRMKRQLNLYSITEYTKMEKHLEEMAEQGWMLKKAGTLLWKYEEMEPKKLHFSIVFFPKTTALEPEPSENLLMLREFCEKTGWKLAAEIGQMQIFYNEEEEPIPIETECWAQLKNIHETAKTNVILPFGILVVNAIVQILLQIFMFSNNPIDWLSGDYNLYLVFLWILLGTGCLGEIIHYVLWYKKAKRIAEEEEYLIEAKSPWVFRMIYLGLSLVVLVLAILSLIGVTSGKYGIYMLIWSAIIVGVPFGVSRFLKAKKVSAKINIIVTLVAGIMVALAMTAGAFWLIMWDADEIFHTDTQMPLQLRDLKTGNVSEYEKIYQVNESMILSHIESWEIATWGKAEEEYISLEYDVIQVKVDWAYKFCKEEFLHKYDDIYEDVSEWASYGFQKVDMPVWQADEVYQRYTNRPRNEFVLCYEERIIRIEFDWDVTEEELLKASEMLQSVR